MRLMKMKLIVTAFVALVATVLPTSSSAQTVDHRSLPAFDTLSPEQVTAASNLRMVFVNRSVGHNIDQGLACLSAPFGSAPNYCKRTNHPAPEFSVPESAIAWSGTYPRSRWHFGSWPGTGITPEINCGTGAAPYWYDQVECFINFVDANASAYDVFSFQFSYLEVTSNSDIADPIRGFFGVAVPEGRKAAADIEALRQRHPQKKFVLQTTSLARGIGTAVSRDFNAQMRTYTQQNGWPLLDVAAILSHDISGTPCYDNRDGVAYIVNGTVRENYPNDGFNYPAICQQYTSEVNGGHLGSPSAGMIRAAKGWWVMMSQLAGSGGNPPPPPPPSPDPPELSAVSCVVEGTLITCSATFGGDVSETTGTITVRTADGQSVTRSVTVPVVR